MNNQLFDSAYTSYQQKDYEAALLSYTQLLQDRYDPPGPGEMGLLYHQIGNCLVKLKNPEEALQAYAQAKADPAYPNTGTVACNLGMTYASLRDYDNAIANFEIALEDPDYDAPYKAHMGMGSALMKMGKTAEAGVSFREAALDEGNPEPAKALLNLGVCFMALNRPADAVASYESAMQFSMDNATRNKLNASLGQAYVACNQMRKAADAFERTLEDKTYLLSDSASVDYQRAIASLAQLGDTSTADTSGVDVSSEIVLYEGGDEDPFFYDEGVDDPTHQPGYVGAYEDDGEMFFSASEDEIEEWSKDLAKKDRKRRNVGLKALVAIVVVVILLLGAAVFAYVQGFGFPTQEMVAKQLFSDPQSAPSSGGVFAGSVSENSAKSMVDAVVQDADVTIDGVNRSLSESTVFATARTDQGGLIEYRLSMVRDMIGWKISNVELYFPSQN